MVQFEKATEKAKVTNDNIEPPYPKQLIIDMPIHWSWTDLMLNQACAKLDALQLSKYEWDCVKLFLDLLVIIT